MQQTLKKKKPSFDRFWGFFVVFFRHVYINAYHKKNFLHIYKENDIQDLVSSSLKLKMQVVVGRVLRKKIFTANLLNSATQSK